MLHTTQMILAMILSGFLSSMSIWSNSLHDIRISLNDLYMTSLMTSWMFLFMGIFQIHLHFLLLGALGVLISFYLIRKQIAVTPYQYVQGMIPHHSMAVFMSRRLLQRQNVPKELKELARRIVNLQEKEIQEMKKMI